MYLGVSVVSVFVTAFAFVTCYSSSKNDKNDKLNGNKDYELQQRANGINYPNNENNNFHPLMQRPYEPDVELRPRPRLPGILHFMFES